MSEQTMESHQEVTEHAENPNTEPTIEETAHTMGWVPKEEFRGNPDYWTDAETFVKKGHDELPVLRSNVKNMSRKMIELEKTLIDQQKFHENNTKAQVERAKEEALANMRAAAEEGDMDAFDRAQKAHNSIEEPKFEPRPGPDPELTALQEQWKEDNPWYSKDVLLMKEADEMSAYIAQARPELIPQQNLDATAKAIVDKYPHKFQNQRRKQPAPVASGGRKPSPSGKTFNSLPQEAKDAFARMQKMKIMSDDGAKKQGFSDAKDQYVKTYQWDK
jgi:hypothetical protein